jgi:PhnB protein
MKELSPYLTFDGNCRQAMEFYKQCLGGDLQMMTFADSKMDVPASAKDRILHARLSQGPIQLLASDTVPGKPIKFGDNFTLSVTCDTVEEANRLFAAVGEKGKVTMPLQETFWAQTFGMLTDQFGINWMFNVHK